MLLSELYCKKVATGNTGSWRSLVRVMLCAENQRVLRFNVQHAQSNTGSRIPAAGGAGGA